MSIPVRPTTTSTLYLTCILCMSVFGENGCIAHRPTHIRFVFQTVRPSTKYISVRLWESIWKEAVELYDVKDPVKLKSTRPQSKTIKEEIAKFVNNNVDFICEVPSVCMIDTGLSRLHPSLPFTRLCDQMWLDPCIIR